MERDDETGANRLVVREAFEAWQLQATEHQRGARLKPRATHARHATHIRAPAQQRGRASSHAPHAPHASHHTRVAA